jgi:hypothetical protein
MPDMVNNPPHYTRLSPQPIDVIESWGLGFNEGQVLKYVARAGHKEGIDHGEDLKKARYYLERAIAIVDDRDEMTREMPAVVPPPRFVGEGSA